MNSVDKKTIEKLPLAGIRVLDMTRVLAGVRLGLDSRELETQVTVLIRHSHTVHKYLRTSGTVLVLTARDHY